MVRSGCAVGALRAVPGARRVRVQRGDEHHEKGVGAHPAGVHLAAHSSEDGSGERVSERERRQRFAET